MSTTLTGTFDTRRDAEMAVERLVQEVGLERTDIFLAPIGRHNSVGTVPAGSDIQAGEATAHDRQDAPLSGKIEVSVDSNDPAMVAQIKAAFTEFGGSVASEE